MEKNDELPSTGFTILIYQGTGLSFLIQKFMHLRKKPWYRKNQMTGIERVVQ